MKDMSEPTGSTAPVIQHSSLPSPSPSSGPNGIRIRAAAEAMSVLARMGQHQQHQQRREERDGGRDVRDGPSSHIIMATHSHHSAR